MKGKQPPLSPRKYIETRARSLPVYKCWINPDWKAAGLADIVVSRRHVNGHLTAAVYLVDLKCLGIKDTVYFFNEPEEDLRERLRLDEGHFTEIDYNLAHNIVYAGHDFAEEYGIHPHKEFSTTKFLLEEDTEDVPLVEVPVGDEEGKPLLIVHPGYDYKPVLDKLRKNAGEGNYHFIIGIGEEDVEEDDDDGFDDEDNPLEDLEPDFLDFQHVRQAYNDDLEEALEDGSRSAADERIIRIEQRLRELEETDPGWWPEDEEAPKETPEYTAYDASILLQAEDDESNAERIDELLSDINAANEVANDPLRAKEAISSFHKYAPNETLSFMALMGLPLITITLSLEDLRNDLAGHPPLVQLALAGFSLALQKTAVEESYAYLTGAATVEDAFPATATLHAVHHKLFWAVKSLHAMNHNNKEEVKHYHSLLAVTGIGGRLKVAYAMRFEEWLAEYPATGLK